MSATKHTKGSIPEEIKAITREQFFTPKNYGSLTGNDLYWILYRAASETNTLTAFREEVVRLLDERLGPDTYIVVLDSSENGGDGIFYRKNPRLPNDVAWGGTAGVLPGVVARHGVSCYVFWG
ncbi:hypothetical protein [Chondromyces crocatus]|uniref:Uncharacterized protein n=1 Tax=Chondromyces crocatus TaxID=52 RepID=A0A0K1EG04_CHOCO|nr:hypothetical protein [Chondromyces crocatus]AKT39607.1 uncharacterized protein CMC5_037560 [Chondromyces crocatus]